MHKNELVSYRIDLLLQNKIIPIADFTSYVTKLRADANSGFEDDFDVSC